MTRLLGWVAANWTEYDAICVEQGFDPLELPLPRLLNHVEFVLLRNRKPVERDRIKHDIYEVPAEVRERRAKADEPPEAPEEWQESSELNAFRALAMATGGVDPTSVSKREGTMTP